MCGLAGIISLKKHNVQHTVLKKMAEALEHRGPDGEGFWINETNTVGFAHRRLSIIDLTIQASQPLYYLQYTIIFNGEIYNYIELKDFLRQKGYSFSTKSDTEVIAAAYCFWGKDCVLQFDGMFAFAIYDNLKNEVFIARDSFGEKPLYYHIATDNNFYFASEMKALWAIGIEKEINDYQLLNYLTIGYVNNPTDKSETFYNNIKTLEEGYYLKYELESTKLEVRSWKYEVGSTKYEVESTKYEVRNTKLEVRIGKTKNEKQKTTSEENETITKFSSLLLNSVEKRLRSDVAIGTSLSGGLDSSSIVANIYRTTEKKNYKHIAFTASFSGFNKDETQYSKAVAKYFNLQQHITSPTAIDLVNNFKQLMYYQEEPLQSASVFTQFIVYKLAKENGVTVLLDGQGADEVLGGYKKYANWFLQELLRTNIAKFKQEKALLITNEFLENWNYKNYFAAFFPKLTAQQLQQKAINQQHKNGFINKDYLHQYQNKNSLQKPVVKELQDILNYNTEIFGLNELLRYADRNSMANSIEVRLPFLSKDLVNFANKLPSSYKINNGFTKWILRESAKNNLPHNIVWRKGKIGYEPPQKQWMKHPQMQEMIRAAREKLVEKNILNNKIFEQNIMAKPAHEGNNFDWWTLCAAELF